MDLTNKRVFLKNDNDNGIFVSIELLEKFGLNPSEAKFLRFMIAQQISRGDDWIITDFEEIAAKMDVKKVTVQRWFAKLSEYNILIQQGNRRPLWKVNPIMLKEE